MKGRWAKRLLTLFMCPALIMADASVVSPRSTANSEELPAALYSESERASSLAAEEDFADALPGDAFVQGDADSGETKLEPPTEQTATEGQDALPGDPLPDASDSGAAQLPAEEAEAGDARIADELTAEEETSPSEEDEQAQPEEALVPWLAELTEANLESEYDRALWIYRRLIECLRHGNEANAAKAWEMRSASSIAYAEIYATALNAVGIECRILVGEDSSWNIAKLEDTWTQIDAYADDVSEGFGLHFGLNDAAMARDHVWQGDYPPCTGLQQSYLVHDCAYRAFHTADELYALLREAVEARQTELLLLDGSTEEDSGHLVEEYLAKFHGEITAEVSVQACRVTVLLHYDELDPGQGDSETGESLLVPDEAGPGVEASTAVPEEEDATDAEIVPLAIVPQESSLLLGEGERASINYTLLPQEARGEVDYSSNSPDIVSVDAEGELLAKRVGNAVLTLSLSNQAERACDIEISVQPAPRSVEILSDRDQLYVGETMQLGFRLSPGSAGKVHFSIAGDRGIAEIDPAGELKALAPGRVRVRVESYNGVSDEREITIASDPLLLQPPIKDVTLCPGEHWQPQWQISAADAGELHFSSSDVTVATVDADSGEITALEKFGEAVITAEGSNGERGEIHVTVAQAPSSIVLTAERLTIGVKEQLQLTPSFEGSDSGNYLLQYTSSKAGVASVDQQGMVTAKKAGSTTITAQLSGEDIQGSITITVKKAPGSVRLKVDRKQLGVGEKLTLRSTLPSGTEGKVTYSIPPEQQGIAGITADGQLEALAEGKLRVTATTYNGKTDSAEVEILPAPTSIIVDKAPEVLGVGASAVVKASVNEGSAGKLGFRLAEAGNNCIEVDGDGKITALAPGTATVEIYTYVSDVSAAVTIQVLPAPEEILLPEKSIRLGVDDSYQLVPLLKPENSAASFTYSSGNSKRATVSKSGLVHVKKTGKVTITIQTHNGLQAKLTVNVKNKPETVSIQPKSLVLGIGESDKVAAQIPQNSATTLQWESSQPSIAYVDGDGNITGISEGEASAIVRTHNGKSANCQVKVVPAPASVQVYVPEQVGEGQTIQVECVLEPEGSSSALDYEVIGDAIEINNKKEIVAVKAGEATLHVSTFVPGVEAERTITVLPAPDSLSFAQEEYVVAIGETLQLFPTMPDGTMASLDYSIEMPGYFTIDDHGIVTPIKRGKSKITATTHNGVSADTTIWVVRSDYPEDVRFEEDPPTYLNEGEVYTPQIRTIPETADPQLNWTSSDDGIASVDPYTGEVTAVSLGHATIRASSGKNSGLKLEYPLIVLNPSYPEDVEFAQTPPSYLNKGEVYTPQIRTIPETADPQLNWTSSNTDIASVDPDTGEVTALSSGRVTITASSAINKKLTLEYLLIVLNEKRCLVMPEHRTDINAIDSTLLQIERVRDSAYAELDELELRGWISTKEKEKRRGYITRAFDMYYFPWMTKTKEKYWRAANSEGGRKDFKPGIVYYGMPYTQKYRDFDVEKLISGGYFKDSGDGYYLMRGGKFKDREYPGNDCSSFVSRAIWGSNSSLRNDSTSKIASASYYVTPKGKKYWKDLRPGDLICDSGHHVAMFLYYANKNRTQFVVIEQGGGGSDLYCNCVSTSIREWTYYTKRGYKIRRVEGLDTTFRKEEDGNS